MLLHSAPDRGDRVRPQTEARHRGRGSRESRQYDAFISYSHEQVVLAVAIQAGLHRFAKPWYRLRAIRVFLDQSSLAAAPSLGDTLTQGLTSSRFLILIASPDAAKSVWVNREVTEWCKTDSPSQILVVLAAGELVWDDSTRGFDWAITDALPEVLWQAFREEPRWIDMRWADARSKSLTTDPRFSDCIADLASPLHGKPKDELAGEDIRQHRRTQRVTRAAVAILTCLALVAASMAVLAVRQRDEAQRQRDRAISRLLAAQARTEIDSRLDRSLLLARQAVAVDETPEARSALLAALARSASFGAILAGHEGRVNDVVFSPDGRTLASAGADGRIILWDTRARRAFPGPLVRQPTQVSSLDFSPDGRLLASGSVEGTVTIWDVQKRVASASARVHHSEGETLVAFSPDGRQLASAGADEAVCVWDVPSYQPAAILASPNPYGDNTTAHIQSLAFGAGGKVAWTDSEGRAHLAANDSTPVPPLAYPNTKVTSVAFGPGGRLVGAGQQVVTWDLRTGAANVVTAGWRELLPEHSADTYVDVSSSPDRQLLAIVDDKGGVSLWSEDSINGAAWPQRLSGRSGSTAGVALDPTKHYVATSGADGTVVLSDLATQGWLEKASPLPLPLFSSDTHILSDIALSPDGSNVAVAYSENITILNSRDWTFRGKLKGHDGYVQAVAFSPDGSELASGGVDGTVRLWDTRTLQQRGPPMVASREAIYRVRFSGDGTLLAALDGSSGEHAASSSVVAYDLKGGTRRALPSTMNAVSDIAFQPGRAHMLAIASGDGVILWDAALGREVGRLPALPAPGFGTLLAFSADGSMLATSSKRSGTRLWDVAALKALGAPLQGASPQTMAMDLTFTANRDLLLLLSLEGELLVWEVASHKLLADPIPLGRLDRNEYPLSRAIAAQPGGGLVVIGGTEGLSLWNSSTDSWNERACTVANRNLSPAEWNEVLPDVPYRPACPPVPEWAAAPG